MKITFLLPALLSSFYFIQAQSIYAPVSARVIAMGDASVTMEGFWASFQNSAGICNTETVEAGFSYENRFGMSGLGFIAAGVTSKLPFGFGALTCFRFGDELYSEQKVSLSYASEIGIIKIGGKLNYLQYKITDFGSEVAYSIDFGGITNIGSKVSIGAQALNISQSSLKATREQQIPTLLKLGISYQPQDYFSLNAEIEKDIIKPTLLKMGCEYNFLHKFYLRSGLNSASFQSFYGVGFRFLSFQWDYALSNHAELGFSHSLSMHFKLREK